MTIWNPLKNFGGAPPNAREWPSSRATQEAKLRGAARRRDGVGVLTNLRAKAWRHAVKFQRSDIGTPPPIGLEPHRLSGLNPESLSRCFRPASTRGDVGIAQDVDFNLQTVQAILDYIADADDTSEPAVAQHWHVRTRWCVIKSITRVTLRPGHCLIRGPVITPYRMISFTGINAAARHSEKKRERFHVRR